uniref:Uncharacterized protein n=1 Tax=Picea glauca TaxID=3330 RepID=A0A117NHB2_PICGL|nr:hypothetical protein ABT39_MTgene5079 [Picea glauca]
MVQLERPSQKTHQSPLAAPYRPASSEDSSVEKIQSNQFAQSMPLPEDLSCMHATRQSSNWPSSQKPFNSVSLAQSNQSMPISQIVMRTYIKQLRVSITHLAGMDGVWGGCMPSQVPCLFPGSQLWVRL